MDDIGEELRRLQTQFAEQVRYIGFWMSLICAGEGNMGVLLLPTATHDMWCIMCRFRGIRSICVDSSVQL